eukprot:UN21381
MKNEKSRICKMSLDFKEKMLELSKKRPHSSFNYLFFSWKHKCIQF